jgi:MYXO-CTERM domain-containing protein
VLEVTPSAVLTAGGQIVSVRGAGFAFGAVASVDGVPVATELLNPATLTFATPTHAAGPAAVSVANPTGLSDTLHGALAYADQVAPVSGVEAPGAADSPEPADRSCAVGPSPGPVPLLLLGLAASTRRRRPRP